MPSPKKVALAVAGVVTLSLVAYFAARDFVVSDSTSDAPAFPGGGSRSAVTIVESDHLSIRSRMSDLLLIDDRVERHILLRDFLADKDREELLSLATVLDNFSHEVNPDEFAIFLERLGSLDGPAAVDFANELDEEMHFGVPMSAALRGWTSADPAAAQDWAASRFHSHGFNPFTEAIYDGWMMKDPDAARASVTALEHPLEIERALRAIFINSEASITATEEWIGSLPAGEIANQARTMLLEKVATQDPGEAIARIDGLTPEVAVTEATAQTVVRHIAEEFGASELISWAEQQQSTERWTPIGDAVIREITADDPNRIARWLSDTPESQMRDAFIERFVMEAAPIDPEAVANWAQVISDPALRNLSVGNSIIEWLAQDETAALAWMAENDYGSILETMFSTPEDIAPENQ